jgi:class 3 adenylate cyclase
VCAGGDGVFLTGRLPRDVAEAALECMDLLACEAGLTSRSGLAYGPVVRRAGDFFGLTVHLSHALTKAAAVRSLLATDVGSVDVAGLDLPVRAAEVSGPSTALPSEGHRPAPGAMPGGRRTGMVDPMRAVR